MVDFNRKIDIRHQIAKVIEGINYAIGKREYPPYLTVNLKCAPFFNDDTYNNEFSEMWNEKADALTKELLTSTVSYIDNQIGLTFL